MTELAEVIAGIEDFSALKDRKSRYGLIVRSYHTGNIMNKFRLTLVGVKEKARNIVRDFLGDWAKRRR